MASVQVASVVGPLARRLTPRQVDVLVVAVTVALSGPVLAVAYAAVHASGDGRALGHLTGMALGYGVAWVLGDHTRTRHAHLAQLEDRARRAGGRRARHGPGRPAPGPRHARAHRVDRPGDAGRAARPAGRPPPRRRRRTPPPPAVVGPARRPGDDRPPVGPAGNGRDRGDRTADRGPRRPLRLPDRAGSARQRRQARPG